MKAACLHGVEDLRIDDISEARPPAANEAVIRVASVGVCGSDLHSYEDGRGSEGALKAPIILGHEFSGTVTAVGEGARDGEGNPLKVGQRVAVEPALACWYCDKCEEGNPNLCRNLSFMGLAPEHGALREFLTVPSRNCFPIPEAMSFELAALLEPLGIAIHSNDLAKIRVGESVTVLGCGLIGLLIIQMARLSGANPIIAVDQHPWRLDAAKRCGADAVVNFKEENPVEAIQALTNGRGTDIVFEAAWARESIAQAVEIADLAGTVMLVGIPTHDADVIFNHATARRKGLTLKMVRRMKNSYPRAIKLAMSDRLQLESLISHHFSLDQVADAFAMNSKYQDEVLKVVIDVQ
jgi:L-iditol 2-dehydrogenase